MPRSKQAPTGSGRAARRDPAAGAPGHSRTDRLTPGSGAEKSRSDRIHHVRIARRLAGSGPGPERQAPPD